MRRSLLSFIVLVLLSFLTLNITYFSTAISQNQSKVCLTFSLKIFLAAIMPEKYDHSQAKLTRPSANPKNRSDFPGLFFTLLQEVTYRQAGAKAWFPLQNLTIPAGCSVKITF
ncbi:MAG: hypothetical protein H5U05_09770 [Candidatus Aminicenantes bacterium]|nr:hypothetical protein [Candidatus Aminicenantes bacterium]